MGPQDPRYNWASWALGWARGRDGPSELMVGAPEPSGWMGIVQEWAFGMDGPQWILGVPCT